MTGGIKLIQSTLLKLAERRIFESSIPFTTSEGNDSTSAALLVLRSVLAFINGLIGEFDWISKNGAWVAVSTDFHSCKSDDVIVY